MGGILTAIVVIIVILIAAQLIFNITGLFLVLLSWMLAGMFAGRILRGRGYGPIVDVLLGLAGGIVGSFILNLLRLGWVDDIWIIGNILVGIVGALILVWLVRTVNPRFGR
jgi:uncharacterized membrane protein YeaQ/YmgE (transglycosylase-associated protein family)